MLVSKKRRSAEWGTSDRSRTLSGLLFLRSVQSPGFSNEGLVVRTRRSAEGPPSSTRNVRPVYRNHNIIICPRCLPASDGLFFVSPFMYRRINGSTTVYYIYQVRVGLYLTFDFTTRARLIPLRRRPTVRRPSTIYYLLQCINLTITSNY